MSIKVLIIDDDSSMTELLGMLLEKNGMNVISTASGMDGLELARVEHPDIIILDLLLPETDEWEVCKTLRTFTNVPIAILSALDDPHVISSALDAGADDYMSKPVPNMVLLAHIHNLTRRYAVESQLSSMLKNNRANNKASATNLS